MPWVVLLGMRMRVPVIVTLLASLAWSCNFGVVCTTEFRYGLNVTVTDSATGSPPDEATLVVTSGTFVDSVGPNRPFQAGVDGPLVLVLSAAGERRGVYLVVVRSPGYRDWMQSGIRVTADECHVSPVSLTARLQRL